MTTTKYSTHYGSDSDGDNDDENSNVRCDGGYSDDGYDSSEIALKKGNEAAHHLIKDGQHDKAAIVLNAVLEAYYSSDEYDSDVPY